MPHLSDRDYVQKMAALWKNDHPSHIEVIDGYGLCYVSHLPPRELYYQWCDEQHWYYAEKYYSKIDIKI